MTGEGGFYCFCEGTEGTMFGQIRRDQAIAGRANKAF
jgi:hypothetical protein